MMLYKLFFSLVIIILSVCPYTFAAGDGIHDNGTRGLILNVVPDARLTGMGGAFTALADDSGALFYNPAGLARVEHTEIPIARNYIFQNIGKVFDSMEQVYYGVVYSLRDVKISNIKDPGTIAVTWNEIKDGKLPECNINGNFTGKFHSNDTLLTVAYGKKLIEHENTGTFMLGTSAKIFREKLSEGLVVDGEAFDIGVIWKLPRVNISLGSAVQNIGMKVQYSQTDYCLPVKTSFGIGGKMFNEAINFGLDYTKPHHEEFRLNCGAEFWAFDAIAFRIGYNEQLSPDLGLNAGWGIRLRDVDMYFFYIKEIDINYGHGTHGEFGGDFSLQRLSMNIKFGAD